jgi:hypothetical protein
MAITVQWVCDRDGTTEQSETASMPTGWASLSCTVAIENGGVLPAQLALCPACVTSMGEWMGKPVFEPLAVGRSIIPMET